MIVTKPADFRSKQKKYYTIAYEGEPVIICRPRNENVVMISEDKYRELTTRNRLLAYFLKIYSSDSKVKSDEEIDKAINDAITDIDYPCLPMSEEELLKRIDFSLKQVGEGKFQDAEEALKEICAEIENEAV